MWFRIALISTTHQGQTNDSLQGPWVQSLGGSCIPQFSLTSACDVKMPHTLTKAKEHLLHVPSPSAPCSTLCSACSCMEHVPSLAMFHLFQMCPKLCQEASNLMMFYLSQHRQRNSGQGLGFQTKVWLLYQGCDCSTPRKGLRLGVWSRTVDRTGPLVQMESIISA